MSQAKGCECVCVCVCVSCLNFTIFFVLMLSSFRETEVKIEPSVGLVLYSFNESSCVSVVRPTGVTQINTYHIRRLASRGLKWKKMTLGNRQTEPVLGLNELSLAVCEGTEQGEWKLLAACLFQRQVFFLSCM